MNNPIRVRYFLWLAALLVGFFIIKSTVLLLLNLADIIQRGPDGNEELFEWAIVTGVGAALLPLLLISAWRISRHMLAPLRRIVRTANRIYSGHLEERIEVPSTHDEIAELAVSVNRALDRYEEAVARQRQFAGMASHQLRTPLTAIRSVGEIALRKERSPEEYREALGTMLEEAERLSRVVEQLLMMAKWSGDTLRETFEAVEVSALWDGVLEDLEPLYQAKRIAVDREGADGMMVWGHKGLLHQALINVFANAVRHTPEEGRISLSAERTRVGDVLLRVTDNGPGFPGGFVAQEAGPAVGRPEDGFGAGLGLKIVENILQIHRGQLTCGAAPVGGGLVTLRIPARPGDGAPGAA